MYVAYHSVSLCSRQARNGCLAARATFLGRRWPPRWLRAVSGGRWEGTPSHRSHGLKAFTLHSIPAYTRCSCLPGAMASPRRVWLGAVLLLGVACGAVQASKAGPGEPRRIVVVPALICVGVRRQTSFALLIPAARLLPSQEPPAGAP